MRQNQVKARLASGGHSFGTMVFEFFTPGMAQIMSAAGAEFAIFDMEHGGVGIETIKQQMSFARFTSCAPFVRVPTIAYPPIAAALDAGALGIMAPMVETAEQAALLVASTRYPPAGIRGAAFGVAHDDYEGGTVTEKIAGANKRTLVMALIETATGVANVEAIAATEGIDVLWLGHFDLTNSLGIAGQFDHPVYLEHVARILAAAARHKRAAGVMAADADWARRYLAMGFRIMAYGVDHHVYQSALRAGIDTMRGAVA